MRIVAIEPILVEVPLVAPVQGVHGPTSVQRSVLVQVTTDEGVEGWGNVDPTPGYSLVSAADIHDVVARLAPALVGEDPFNLHRALAGMDRDTAEGFEAKAAIEMALLDIKGRALGVPVHSLLGGALTHEVTLNAWIGTVAPEQAAREAPNGCAAGSRPPRSRSPARATRASRASPPFAPRSATAWRCAWISTRASPWPRRCRTSGGWSPTG